MPQGREFADMRFFLSEYFYDAIEGAMEKTNDRIRRSLRNGQPTDRTRRLQTPLTIATAVKREFPPFLYFTELFERRLRSDDLRARFPGLLTRHRPPRWIYHHIMLVLDPLRTPRLMRCSTIMANGVHFGTDKILHFIHLGYIYFDQYQEALAEGSSEEDAVRAAVELGSGDHGLSERRSLGYIATGVISNGDLAADFAGLKFYRNLTEPVRINDKVLEPILARNGEFHAFNSHVRRDSDFLAAFISPHWNEALNPSMYAPGVGTWVQHEIRERCSGVKNWYRDEQGRPLTRDGFERIAQELSTYFGEPYGHQGNLDEMITVASTCFDESGPALYQPQVASGGASSHIRLVASRPSEFADPSYRDPLGRTALWRAARAGRVTEVQSLLRATPDTDAADIDGDTPLHAAARAGHAEVVRILLQHGAIPNVKNRYGITPLHLAAQHDEAGVVAALLRGGADANAADIFGCTPLHDAAKRGMTPTARLLLQGGARPDAANDSGTTAQQIAAHAGADLG